jgi:small conductance mechanosensitive channel
LFGTTILTPHNVVTLIGNTKIFGDSISNFSSTPARRVEHTAQLAGGVDVTDAISHLRAAVAAVPNVVTEPAA